MPTALKPSPPPAYQSAHALAFGAKWELGLLDNTLATPLDDKDGAACAWSTVGGGTTTPGWGADASGRVGLDFLGTGTFPGTDKELHIPGRGVLSTDLASGVTIHCVLRPGTPQTHSAPVVSRDDQIGFLIRDNLVFQPFLGGVYDPDPAITLTAGNDWALVLVFVQSGANVVATTYSRNATTDVTGTPGVVTIPGTTLTNYSGGVTNDAVVNYRNAGAWCFKGLIMEAGVVAGAWDAAKAGAYLDDPWITVRAVPLASGILTLSMVGSSSLAFSLPTPTGGITPYGPARVYGSTVAGFTPGAGNLIQTITTPTFPQAIALAGVAANVPQYVVAQVDDSATPTPAVVASNQALGVVPTGGVPDAASIPLPGRYLMTRGPR